MPHSLSLLEARKYLLDRQCLLSRKRSELGTAAALNTIEQLGYVQIDALSVVARAHLHTLWNRVDGFKSEDLDKLQRDRKIYEYWVHALAILPMKDYRYSLPMMNRIASGAVHWYPKNSKETKKVLKRIREEGPLSSKDFTDKKTSNSMWARSPSKLALEQLFMEGELMIPYRINFHKVYDLRERVLPAEISVSTPSKEGYCRHLISSFLKAQGFGLAKEIGYLRKGVTNDLRKVGSEMLEDGVLQLVEVAGQEYYCDSTLLKDGENTSNRSNFRILSPFDNAIIQRNRIYDLFGFDYKVECYIPKAKRKFGYFCLPLLHKNKLIGRLDAKADKKISVFHLFNLQFEDGIGNPQAVYRAFLTELKKFACFNGCEEIKLHRLSGATLKPEGL
jgi:uncharacterized protein YcaQ